MGNGLANLSHLETPLAVKPELAQASTVFLETTLIIYFLENHAVFGPPVAEVLQAVKDGTKSAVTSHVTLFSASGRAPATKSVGNA